MYRKMIEEATGRTNPAELEEIEDCMRNDIFHSTLDWQSHSLLVKAAQVADAVLFGGPMPKRIPAMLRVALRA